nr:Gp37 family protein [Pasteurella multocida]
MSATLPILNAFKDRLKTRFAEWDVQLMPENIESYFLAHPNGGILISYAGSTFGEPRSTAEITQTRKVHIVLTVLSRDLHNDHGALQLLDDLRLDVTVLFHQVVLNVGWLKNNSMNSKVVYGFIS